MTVIAIRIKTSPTQAENPDTVSEPGPPSWVDALADRVTNNVLSNRAEVLPDQASAPSTVGGTEDPVSDVPEHVRSTYRFDSNEDKAAILDDVEAGVVADAEWHRIESHECDHDEPADSRTGCADWGVKRESGSVPGGV